MNQHERPTIRVLHLYDQYLNIYADRGNIRVFEQRCAWRGIDCHVAGLAPGERFEPGDYDLAQFLRRKDGSATSDLPKIPVKVTTLLPAGQIEPTALTFRSLPWLGGYRLLMIALAVFWIAGLVWLLYPKRKQAAVVRDDLGPQGISLADRLRPLVSDAMAARSIQIPRD